MSTEMTITVHNKQGASAKYTGTSKTACLRWLRNTWQKPSDFSYVIRDDNGQIVAEKAGR